MLIRVLLTLAMALTLSHAAMAEEKVVTEDGIVLAHPEVPRITAEELKKLIDEKADIVIVDTRDGVSYDYGHVPGAINIYYDPNGDPTDREMTLVALPADKLIALYCP
ncbi:MAG: Rhodanese protein [Gammaproteobacteria bacterium]|nr:Rhodanese protein [Gammaproteobacteria bacterium]